MVKWQKWYTSDIKYYKAINDSFIQLFVWRSVGAALAVFFILYLLHRPVNRP